MKLAEVLKKIPDVAFFKGRGVGRKPDYNCVFAYCLRDFFASPPKFGTLLQQIEAGDVMNLSSFQRCVAKEAARRKAAKR